MRYSIVPRLSSIGLHAALAAAARFAIAPSSSFVPTMATDNSSAAAPLSEFHSIQLRRDLAESMNVSMEENVELQSALENFGPNAYLLTVSASGPHTSHVEVSVDSGALSCALSRTAAQNVRGNANVSLLWPPKEPGGYSIIVNGVLDLQDDQQPHGRIAVSKSVLHRPGQPTGPQSDAAACSSDCVPLSFEPVEG